MQTRYVTRFINKMTYNGLTAMPSIGILSKIEAGIGSCEKSEVPPPSTSSRESTFSPWMMSGMRGARNGSASACCASDVGEYVVSNGLRITLWAWDAPYRRLLPSNARHTACMSSLVRYPVSQRGIVTLRGAQYRWRTSWNERLDLGL